jgi:mono/diheme cytochrome c family protein
MTQAIRWKAPLLNLSLALLVASCGPDESKNKQPPRFVPNLAQGERLYVEHCSLCHGKQGRGTHQGPPLVHEYYKPSRLPDLEFYTVVKKGAQPRHWRYGPMPPAKDLTSNNVVHIIAYVRQEQRRAGIE